MPVETSTHCMNRPTEELRMCSPPTTLTHYVKESSACSARKRPQEESRNKCTATMSMHPAFSRGQKRVAFASTCNVQFVHSHLSWTPAERDAYWYNASEIKSFHMRARETCSKLRTSSTALDTTSTAPVVCRGFELRKSTARQKRKLLTLQCIVRAQRRLQDSDQVARLAARCSSWPAKVAQVEAQRDFIRAYADAKCEALLPPLPPITPFPLPVKGVAIKKRSTTATVAAVQRSVRRRISVC
jgi:hypothetical protein